ncbi:unnamed protein product [Closterium sp. NIES-53]
MTPTLAVLPALPVVALLVLPAAALLRVLPAHCQHIPLCPTHRTAHAALPSCGPLLRCCLLAARSLPCLAAAQRCHLSRCPAQPPFSAAACSLPEPPMRSPCRLRCPRSSAPHATAALPLKEVPQRQGQGGKGGGVALVRVVAEVVAVVMEGVEEVVAAPSVELVGVVEVVGWAGGGSGVDCSGAGRGGGAGAASGGAARGGGGCGGGQKQQPRHLETLSPQAAGVEAVSLGASEPSSTSAIPFEALHTFTLDSRASRYFLLDCTTVTPLTTHVVVTLADPSGGPVVARASAVFPCPAAPSSSLSGLHLPSFATNLHATTHSSFPPTMAPLQTLHIDVWGPAYVNGQDQECYFVLVVDDHTRYTTVFPLHSKADVCSDLYVMQLHSDRGGEFFSNHIEDFYREEGIAQSFTLPASLPQNGIAKRHIGLIMEFARTSMIHAAPPHFLWPFAVRYAAHQLNLWPHLFLPDTLPTLRWTGQVSDSSAFRVWGLLALVRDTTAGKLSSRTIRCVFLVFPTNGPGWQFYHHRTSHVPPPPFASLPGSRSPLGRPPPHTGSCSLRCVLVDPPPSIEPLEVSFDTSGPAEGDDPAVDDIATTHSSPRLETPLDSGGAGSRGADFGGVVSGGADFGGARAGSTGAGGAGARGTGAGGPGTRGFGARVTGVGGAGAGVTGAGAGVTGAGGSGAGVTGAGGAGAGGTGAGGSGAGVNGAGGTGARGTGAGGYERCESASRPASPVRTVYRARRVRPPPVPGRHTMALRPSSVPQRVALPSPPGSSLPDVPDPEPDLARTASPVAGNCMTQKLQLLP